jgi:signal transduction histidine kinase
MTSVRAWRAVAGSWTAGNGMASERAEWLLWLCFCLIRVMTLVLAAVTLGFTWDQFRAPGVMIAVLAVLGAGNVVLGVRCRHRGSLCVTTYGTDICVSLAAVAVAVQAMKPSADVYVVNPFYPYSVGAMALVSLSTRRVVVVVLVTLLACAGYVAATLARFGFEHALLTNAATYWCWSFGALIVARTLRSLIGSLDVERHRAVMLAQRQERAEAARSLRDRVLQTMEVAARDGWILNERLRHQIASDVTWLRAWVEGQITGTAGDLVASLAEVARSHAATGLEVELDTAGITDHGGPERAAGAICGAVAEALTNVRKHAGVAKAVIRVAEECGHVLVTVVDRGRGFDPCPDNFGFGLRESIVGRIREAGGTVSVASAPGAGTRVELSVPVRAAVTEPDAPQA